jgi:hypothetical protein
MRILAIKSGMNGNALAFGNRGTYNPANRDETFTVHHFIDDASSPGAPARNPSIPKQDPNECGPRNAVAAEFAE